jgi:hypothetical protein
MFANTVSNKWMETTAQESATIDLIVFDVGEVSFGISLGKVDRVIEKPADCQDFNIGTGTQILDLHHRLFGSSIANPTAMVIFRSDGLYGIPLDTTPTLIAVPLDRIRILPNEFRHDNSLDIASHIAMISTPTAELTIFILD